MMKKVIVIACVLFMQSAFAVQIEDHPGTTFGANYKKNDPPPDDKTWGWNNDTDYNLTVTHRTERFRGPASSIGQRIQVNRGTPIRINNTFKPISVPPDVNSGLTQPTKD
jgi:hypothetical protein